MRDTDSTGLQKCEISRVWLRETAGDGASTDQSAVTDSLAELEETLVCEKTLQTCREVELCVLLCEQGGNCAVDCEACADEEAWSLWQDYREACQFAEMSFDAQWPSSYIVGLANTCPDEAHACFNRDSELSCGEVLTCSQLGYAPTADYCVFDAAFPALKTWTELALCVSSIYPDTPDPDCVQNEDLLFWWEDAYCFAAGALSECRTELAICTGGGAGCVELLTCESECEPADGFCLLGCLASGAGSGLDQFNALMGCLWQECGFAAAPSCRAAALEGPCLEALLACTG